jgi:hypothetical protein
MGFALLAAVLIAAAERPGVQIVLVVPPDEQPFPDAQARFDVAMKDIRWWYSCQMEAYGYGPKTFQLELDDKGKVVIHIAKLDQTPVATGQIPGAVIQAAERELGNPGQRQGTIMVVIYNGYYWSDKSKFGCLPLGRGLNGRWAALNAWHYYSLNPSGWNSPLLVPRLPVNNPFFPELHTRVLQAFDGDGTKSVAQRTSVGYGSFMHEMGHAFGLHHPDPKNHPKGDVMHGDYWNVRGNFLPDLLGEFCCISKGDAAVLNKNPLFQRRDVRPPSTGAPRKVGMRGAQSE